MRKCLSVSLILLVLLLQTTFFAFADVRAAGADIPVVIDGGGTAYMIPEYNSPLPTEVSIEVGNGRIGHFYINFTEVGVFRYTIKAGFSKPDGEMPAEEMFRLTVTVYERDGSLNTVSVLNSTLTENKTNEVHFTDSTGPSEPESEAIDIPQPPYYPPDGPQPTTKPSTTSESTTRSTDSTEPPTGSIVPPVPPDTPDTPNTPPNTPGTPDTPGTPETPRLLRIFSAPKTGDETHLAHYLLIAVASSAGLFCLALLYAANTKKLIKRI